MEKKENRWKWEIEDLNKERKQLANDLEGAKKYIEAVETELEERKLDSEMLKELARQGVIDNQGKPRRK